MKISIAPSSYNDAKLIFHYVPQTAPLCEGALRVENVGKFSNSAIFHTLCNSQCLESMFSSHYTGSKATAERKIDQWIIS